MEVSKRTKVVHSEASQPFISEQKCSQFFSLPLSNSSCSFNSSVRKNSEWDSFAPPECPSACCSSLILCPNHEIVCIQHSEWDRARKAWHQIGSDSDCCDEMTLSEMEKETLGCQNMARKQCKAKVLVLTTFTIEKICDVIYIKHIRH